MTSLTKEAAVAARREAARRRPLEELLRPRPHLVALLPPDRPDARVDRGALRQGPAGAWRPTGPPSWPATTSARPPSCSTTRTRCSRPALPPGEYTNITGNTALAWGLVAAGQLADLPVFLGSYPITPASDILHELSKHKNFGVRTFQAEDEIAAVGSALGAAFAGHLGVTTTSGPGVALKSETISLAVSLELPLLIVDIQRGGPSTGLPTKTEAADLNIALYGRHAEAPLPVVAAYSPSHCFDAAIEAARIAAEVPHAGDPAVRRLPGQRLRAVAAARRRRRCPTSRCRSPPSPTTIAADGTPEFWPYLRDPETLARPWAIPGTPGPAAPRRRHREGGRHRQHLLRRRTTTRRWSTCGRPRSPASPTTSRWPRWRATTTPTCWCSAGAAPGAPSTPPSQRARARGHKVAWVHLVHLNPLPANLGEMLRRYPKILVPELNLGQLCRVVRAEYLVDAQSRQQGAGPAVHRRSERRDRHAWTPLGASIEGSAPMTDIAVPITTKKDWTSDQEVRWCPGCGDYGILHRRPDAHARARRAAREHGVRVGHRLLEPLPVLHEHLRHPQHPRAGAGHRHRPGHGPARPRRVGDHRRRRRAVDRRQPPHPRAAPQRQPHDPAVQQPDLRADQGPVLADVASWARSPSRRRSARSTRPFNPRGGGARGRGHVRGPHPRPRPQAHDGGRSGPPTTTRARRSSRSARTATSSTTARSTTCTGKEQRPGHADPARARPADPLRRRRRQGRGDGHRRPAAHRRGGRRRRGRPPRARRPPRRSRAWPSPWPACRTTSTRPRRSACSARSSGPSTPRSQPPAHAGRRAEGPRRPRPPCCARTAPGRPR